jgi:hypothetical protein
MLLTRSLITFYDTTRYTFAVELVPICKWDVVCIHPHIARKHGNIGQIAICDHVGSSLRFVDPMTLKAAEITSDAYWKHPFYTVCPQNQLIECVWCPAPLLCCSMLFFRFCVAALSSATPLLLQPPPPSTELLYHCSYS